MEILGLLFIWGGVAFCGVGVLGMVRMPDLYCRLHAAGKVSTVGLCGLLLGAAFIMPVAALKLLALAIFAILTLPVGTHVIAAGAYRHGVMPLRTQELKVVTLPAVEMSNFEAEQAAA